MPVGTGNKTESFIIMSLIDWAFTGLVFLLPICTGLCSHELNKHAHCSINGMHLWIVAGVSFLFFSIFYWRMLTVSNGCMWAAIHTGRAQTVGQSDGSSLSFNTSNKFRPVKVSSGHSALFSGVVMAEGGREGRGQQTLLLNACLFLDQWNW